MLETDRLRLRAMRKTDFDSLFALQNDFRVQPMLTLDHVVPSGPKYEEELMKMSSELFYAVIEIKKTGEFIGFTILFSFQSKNRDAKLGLALVPGVWERGYGTEVVKFMVDYGFRELGLHRVTLNVFGSNTRAIGLYQKIGFVQEGVQRKANWIGGKWEDVIWMGILEEDWRASIKETNSGP
ncbi:hypothetical protein D9757_000990 [Collybiopsis confluens]|uniref:N-acetyltransferase domain-containing protein n=1 Tax=Collybiopsis confluens TaxID=2823264 RepID=A0A8H5I0C0_9AGAR|nr:hypothetical protein D9757_000990 [Collybiopsis confluens]